MGHEWNVNEGELKEGKRGLKRDTLSKHRVLHPEIWLKGEEDPIIYWHRVFCKIWAFELI